VSGLWSGDEGEIDEAGVGGGVVDALGGFAVVGGLGPENVGDESLGIAVVEGEPARLDLDHDAMAGKEDVIGVGKIEAIEQRLVGSDGMGSFEAFAIAAAEDVAGDHELIAAEFGLAGNFVGVDVDEFDDPVGVGAAGGSDEVGDRLAADFDRSLENVGGEDENVGAAGGLTLVVDEPFGPSETGAVGNRLDGSCAEGNGLAGIGDVFVERSVGGTRRIEAQFQASG